MTHSRTRPWYCHDPLVDDYRAIATAGGDLTMLKRLKIARSIVVNLGIISITLFALLGTAADPTVVFVLGMLTLGLYNGVEVADYAALAQAFAEVRAQQPQQGQDGGDGDGS